MLYNKKYLYCIHKTCYGLVIVQSITLITSCQLNITDTIYRLLNNDQQVPHIPNLCLVNTFARVFPFPGNTFSGPAFLYMRGKRFLTAFFSPPGSDDLSYGLIFKVYCENKLRNPLSVMIVCDFGKR